MLRVTVTQAHRAQHSTAQQSTLPSHAPANAAPSNHGSLRRRRRPTPPRCWYGVPRRGVLGGAVGCRPHCGHSAWEAASEDDARCHQLRVPSPLRSGGAAPVGGAAAAGSASDVAHTGHSAHARPQRAEGEHTSSSHGRGMPHGHRGGDRLEIMDSGQYGHAAEFQSALLIWGLDRLECAVGALCLTWLSHTGPRGSTAPHTMHAEHLGGSTESAAAAARPGALPAGPPSRQRSAVAA
jgi:hypothetical protein